MIRIIGEIGPPGCGKGTALKHVITPHCERHDIPLVVVPMSDEINSYLNEHPNIAPRVRADMSAGRLVEDAVVIEVLKRCMPKLVPSERKSETLYVLDGMPRTMGQIETCLHLACEIFEVSIKDYIFTNFITPSYLCGFRAAKRDEGRVDDGVEEVFMTRCEEFRNKTLAAIHFLEKNAGRMGYQFVEVDGRYLRSQPHLAASQIFGH
jgi:adenylate kinase family enzyme